MATAAKKMNGKYIRAGYSDKIVFRAKSKVKTRPAGIASWKRSAGLWANHPVFQGLTVKETIEWLRGRDSDV